MKYDIVISEAALSMLDNHIDFLARVNPGAAVKLMDEILRDIESLSENPLRFPSYENQFIANNRYRKMLSGKRYLVIYEVSDATVNVDYIVDCRQDYQNSLFIPYCF